MVEGDSASAETKDKDFLKQNLFFAPRLFYKQHLRSLTLISSFKGENIKKLASSIYA